MKKTFLFAALAAFSMISCTNNELPEAEVGYGYINVNVSNDAVVETRASETVSSIEGWQIKTKKGTEGNLEDWSSNKAYAAGEYTVFAQNYADEAAWKAANANWGAAFYQGSGNVTVAAGQTNSAIIDCKTAKNAKLTVNIGELPSTFTDVKVLVKRSNDITLTFPTEGHTEAFFGATETVSFSLSYKYNSADKTILDKTITMKGAATNNIINVTANSNGLISVTIKVDETFENVNNETLTFDGATGNEAQNNQQGS